ncbi:MAG: hypothetical protein AAFY11_13445 [Cyanobacteria bacterium J06641_5]
MLEFIGLLSFDTTTIAGTCLWAFALYLGLASWREWFARQLERWFNFAERSLYFSQEEYEQTRTARESQNAFYASVLGIIPFLALGLVCNYAVELGLGRSWAFSVGMLGCMACGVYDLGRRAGDAD